MSDQVSTQGKADANYVVSIIRHGTRSTTKSDVFLNYPLYGVPDEPIEMDYFAWVIQNDERTVLLDTGYSRHGGESRNRAFVLDLPTAYHTLGVDPDAAPTVIISHFHYDHTGNLDFFPKSEIVMARDEYEFWTGPLASREQFHHSLEEPDLTELVKASAEGRVTLFDGRYTVAPGIEILQVGGHTPGQSVVSVATSEGVVLLASDAIHYYEEYEDDRPFTYVANLVDMYKAFDMIHELERSGAVQHVVSGHDASTLGRFTPVEGELAGFVATIGTRS